MKIIVEELFSPLAIEKFTRHKGKLRGDHRGLRASEGLTEKAKVENQPLYAFGIGKLASHTGFLVIENGGVTYRVNKKKPIGVNRMERS